MIYAAFTLWLLLILFAGIGVFRLVSRLVKPSILNWVLLPGTIVSEMAYIFGCLITGGEVRRAKLLPGKVHPHSKTETGEPTTETAGGMKVVSPIVASLLTILACAAAILLIRKLLGSPVIDKFIGIWPSAQVPQKLPTSMADFWEQIEAQVRLLRRMSETLWKLDWLDWRAPLFVYLAACLSIRIAPVNRPIRPTLAAAAVIAALIGLIGLVIQNFAGLMNDVWPLLTYIWANLLFLLALALLITGGVSLARILAGKEK